MKSRFACAAVALAAPATRPNIVFVLVDDMGYADLGCYGAKGICPPHVDRLAREDVRFTDFYSSAPVCTPTRYGFITGRWQQRVGLEWAFGFTADAFRCVRGHKAKCTVDTPLQLWCYPRPFSGPNLCMQF